MSAPRPSVLAYEDLKNQNNLYAETLRLMISYLGHQDQDANHEWMVRKMREALNGIHPGAAIEAQLKAYDLEIAASEWNGLCPAGKHGLDRRDDVCDLCPKEIK